MPSTLKAAGTSIQKVAAGDAPVRASKLPVWLQFPLLLTLSLALSSLLYSLVAQQWTTAAVELASVSRRLDKWWEVGAVVGWRAIELAIGWFGNYDGYDLAALSVLSHGPPIYLLHAFYRLTPQTSLLSLAIDTITTYLPFRLLRPLSLAHSSPPPTSGPAKTTPNNDIISDLTIQLLTTFLASAIYAVTLYTAYASSYLPVALVTHFSTLTTVEPAHKASYITLLPLSLILGLAARVFIFTPITASAITNPNHAAAAKAFDPVTATLGETFWYNVDVTSGLSPRTKALVKRTLTLIFVVAGNCVVQLAGTVEGVEVWGAVEYAAVWVLGAALVGGGLGAVGAV